MEYLKKVWDDVISKENYFNNIDTPVAELENKRDWEIIKKFISKKKVVLDLGCGYGRLAKVLDGKVKEYHGIDVSSVAIDKAKELCKNCRNTGFYIGNGENLDIFKNDVFDLVFSVVVFQHIHKMMVFEYLREILRVLKVGGKFCLQFVDYYYGGQNEWQKGTLEQNFKKISELKMWGGSINFYKEEELKQLFEKLGVEFNIEDLNLLKNLINCFQILECFG